MLQGLYTKVWCFNLWYAIFVFFQNKFPKIKNTMFFIGAVQTILGKLQLMWTTWMLRMRGQSFKFLFADARFKVHTKSFPISTSLLRNNAK